MSDTYNPAKKYKHSKLLYQILPSVYRERDSSKDLQKFLNGTGVLLDQMHSTLLQRYADIFPDSDDAYDIDSQTWLLPYIAALFDVRMASPTEDGQREEIANAISWRKGKGTISVVEEVAEKVGGMEIVVHEGWKRVATTARVGMPVLPLESYGYKSNANNNKYENNFNDYQNSSPPDRKPDLAPMWARHPGLPAGTVDMRCQASAVKAMEANPAAVISEVSGNRYRWRQSSLHGAQNCNEGHSILPFNGLQADWIPGYFDDPSVRTVDFRDPDWRKGHFHPRQVLLFTATHQGWFAPIPPERRFQWDDTLPDDEDFLNLVSVKTEGSKTVFRNKSLDEDSFTAIRINGNMTLNGSSIRRFEGFLFNNTLKATSAHLELNYCAVRTVVVNTVNLEQSVLQAGNCLFNQVRVNRGLAQLQYCTVLDTTVAEKLNASGCIFNGLISKDNMVGSLPGKGCVRYSSILPEQDKGELQFFDQHKLQAVFYSDVFGEPGCGVLHPATAKDISSGAEDGGEMGAYHYLHLVARQQAVIKKLADFLPTGMKAVVIPDGSLHDLPGKIND